jgi:integrase
MAHGYRFIRLIKGRYPMFRTKETGDVSLPGPIGSPAFLREYANLLDLRDARRLKPGASADGSWAWLIDLYLASPEYAALADSTQLDYSKTCALLRDEIGNQPVRFTTRAMLKAVRDDRSATPRQAHKIKQMASRLASWADEQGGIVPEGFNPAKGLKRLQRKGGVREITVWSDAEIDWVLAKAGPSLRTPLMIALYTGQRREDVAGMRWNQWQGDVVRVRTSKTRALLDIACHPALRTHLEQLRASRKVIAMTGEIALTEEGRRWSVNGLSGKVRRVIEKIDAIPGSRSLHGLRYAAAARMEEGGATHAEIAEVLGQRTFRMALKYAGQRVRARAAVAAMPAGNATGTKGEGGN